MPGFNICNSGDGPSATIETRRKHRWVFAALGKGSSKAFNREILLLLLAAQRPKVKFEEPEMHHNQEVARFAGKQDWEPITLNWYDAEQPDSSAAIYDWFKSVVDFSTANVNPPSQYKSQGNLHMIDGAAAVTENWQICNCWPKEGNWGDLDYSDTEIATIEVVMRFDRAYMI